MIKIYRAEDINSKWLQARRELVADADVDKIVAEMIAEVRENGDSALLSYEEKFDHARLSSLKVSEAEIEQAWQTVDEDFRAVLEEAASHIRAYHRAQLREDIELPGDNGVRLGQRFTAIEKVGIYVPGGTAAYPSSVLMNAIPASLAGCERIIMVTPPRADGSIAPDILAAAKVAGVTDIYKVGGAQAIAALAYGTESIPRVSKIVGPGNIFVATAKKQVYGVVSIDMVAGPSEILVIADRRAKASWLAADMLSQAEHDRRASAMLICLDETQAKEVSAELYRQLDLLPRKEMATASIENNGAIIIAEDLAEAADIANAIAPEHLELAVEDPFALLQKIRNAGSIFLGDHSPEPVGDYWAGANHVLPTLGLATCCGPLSVDDFIKRSSYIYYTEEALKKDGAKIQRFAKREGLDAHAASVAIRLEDN